MWPILAVLVGLACIVDAAFPDTCPEMTFSSSNSTIGVCPQDFAIIGDALEAVHQSTDAPTGLAVDHDLNIYLTYPRNAENSTNNVVVATSFDTEEPWPSAEIQRCASDQDPSTCFINVQNVVLDSVGQMWIIDSGIAYGSGGQAVSGGAKIMSFNLTTRALIKTYLFPDDILFNKTNLNDVRINNTAGFAFLTDESPGGGVVALDLATGAAVKRLSGTFVVMADPTYVGMYDGRPIYCWSSNNNGTTKNFCNTGSDGIALQGGNVYWGNLASRRFYYVSQAVMRDFGASDAEVLAAVQDPGELGSEQAGFTADDQGRVFMLAGEHNSILYVQTDQARVTEEVNGVPPGGSGPVAAKNYYVKTLVRSGLVQHADSAAIMDGYLYFCTNQLGLSPSRQYKNVDARKGPFRSYRVNIGAGPAV